MRPVFIAAVLVACFYEGANGQSAAYRLDKIADGIYLASPTTPRFAANVPVIVNDRDVVLVGSHFTPAAARALVDEVKAITDRPVRFIINTHYHAAQPGTAVEPYPPGIEVVGHELARRTLLFDSRGRPRPSNAIGVPPTVGMTTRLSLYRGDREIRVQYVGRGHSDNDVVVFLPKERILCSGELLVNGLPDMGYGNITDWVSTLEALKPMDFQTVLPARGAPFSGKEKISALQSYLRDLLTQATELLNKDVTPEETARKVDLTSHNRDFPEIRAPGVDVAAVQRLKTQIEEPEVWEP